MAQPALKNKLIFLAILFATDVSAFGAEVATTDAEISSRVVKIESASNLKDKTQVLAELKGLLLEREKLSRHKTEAFEKELAVTKSQIIRAKGEEKKLLSDKYKKIELDLTQARAEELQVSTWMYTFDPHFEVTFDKAKPDCKFLLHALTLAYNLKDNQIEPESVNGQLAFRVGRALCPAEKK